MLGAKSASAATSVTQGQRQGPYASSGLLPHPSGDTRTARRTYRRLLASLALLAAQLVSVETDKLANVSWRPANGLGFGACK